MQKINADLIIFDLDGTLIDSKKDIAFAVNETLEQMNIPKMKYEDIYGWVGNGVRPLIEKTLEDSGKKDEIATAIEFFRESYIAHLLDTTVTFDGVRELLDYYRPNKKMAVASNKPYRYVEKILDGLKLSGYFLSVKGGDSVENKKPEPEMLLTIMEEISQEPGNSVFIGDSGVDIETGKNAGVKTVGVTYGFRSRKEVLESQPDAIIESPLQLKEIIV